MKPCISLILACLLVLALFTGCSENANVSTSTDGMVNGGQNATESTGILDIPSRDDNALDPSMEALPGENGAMSRNTGR